MIKKSGNNYLVTDSLGEKILGRHESKEKALQQLRAIEASKAQRRKTDESKILSFAEYLTDDA